MTAKEEVLWEGAAPLSEVDVGNEATLCMSEVVGSL